MPSAIIFPSTISFPHNSAVMATAPTSRGRFAVNGLVAYEAQVLPTDATGNFALTLTNIVVGSIYEVEVASTGVQITIGTAAASTVLLNIPVYTNPTQNALRIKVRKATATPYYQPYETQATAVVGSAGIFVNQLSDE